jgi:hypothetical protein
MLKDRPVLADARTAQGWQDCAVQVILKTKRECAAQCADDIVVGLLRQRGASTILTSMECGPRERAEHRLQDATPAPGSGGGRRV